MNSSLTLSPFTEHSFRRLKLLIHQQDALEGRNIRSNIEIDASRSSKTIEEDSSRLSDDQTNESFSLHHRSSPMRQRTFIRPPKSRTISYRCSSNPPSDPLESSFDRSSLSKKTSDRIQQLNNERTLYEQRIETDRRNDLREKYNIPPPFERQWLRQPRYVPQERPQYGQIKTMNN